MPKPLLLRRPSGLYVRFLLPASLRECWGVRCLVRSLGDLRHDAARLAAARMGYALAQAVRAMRTGSGAMIDKELMEAVLAAAARGETRNYGIDIPGVVSMRADGPEDHARAMEAFRAMIPMLPSQLPSQLSRPAAAATVPKSGPMLHEAIERFLKDFKKKGRSAATELETHHSLTLFRDLVDDVPMEALSIQQIDAFTDAMETWPARARVIPKYKHLSAREIVAAGREDGVPGLEVRTMEKHLDRIRVFFHEAERRRELPYNPLKGYRLQTTAAKYDASRRAFRPEELALIFDPTRRAVHQHDPMFFWLPLINLFIGARLREVAQLAITDLEPIVGVWGVHLTTESTKTLKNANSKRFVPLPDRLLSLGLLEYAQEMKALGHTDLFPGGSIGSKNGPGDKMSRHFNRGYLRRVCGIEDPDVCFHCFRHTLITAADRLSIPESRMARITGHAQRSIQAKHYIDAPTVPERKKDLDLLAQSIELPPLGAYEPGQFNKFLEELSLKHRHAAAQAARTARHAHPRKK